MAWSPESTLPISDTPVAPWVPVDDDYERDAPRHPRISMCSTDSNPARELAQDPESVAERQVKRAAIRESISMQGGKIRGRQTEKAGNVVDISQKSWFILAFGIVSIINLIVVGAEVDNGCREGWLVCTYESRMSWYLVENAITLLMLIEMGIRIASGPKMYFMGDVFADAWGIHMTNVIDFLLVMVRCLDTWILAPAKVQTPIKIISCIRVLHLSELVRRAHNMRTFRELWMILHGVWHASRVVFWTVVVLFLILYVGAIIMTDQVIKQSDPDIYDYSMSAWTAKPWTVHDYWGSVPRSLLSMFQLVTLDHWASTLMRPLVARYPGFMLFITPFMTVTVLSLLNVIVAVIVESTLASASVNEEKVARDDRKAHQRIMDSLQEIFETADTDGSGELDKEEIARAWSHGHVRDRMKILQMDYSDLTMLFDLLDEAGTGQISTTKFFRGCTRLQGLAMASDLHHMSIDFGRYILWGQELVHDHQCVNHRLSDLLADVEGLDRDIVKGGSDHEDPVLMNRRDRYHREVHAANHGGRDFYESDSNMSEKWVDQGWRQDNHSNFSADPVDAGNRSTSRRSLVSTTLQNTDIGFDMNDVRRQCGKERHMTIEEEYDFLGRKAKQGYAPPQPKGHPGQSQQQSSHRGHGHKNMQHD